MGACLRAPSRKCSKWWRTTRTGAPGRSDRIEHITARGVTFHRYRRSAYCLRLLSGSGPPAPPASRARTGLTPLRLDQ